MSDRLVKGGSLVHGMISSGKNTNRSISAYLLFHKPRKLRKSYITSSLKVIVPSLRHAALSLAVAGKVPNEDPHLLLTYSQNANIH